MFLCVLGIRTLSFVDRVFSLLASINTLYLLFQGIRSLPPPHRYPNPHEVQISAADSAVSILLFQFQLFVVISSLLIVFDFEFNSIVSRLY